MRFFYTSLVLGVVLTFTPGFLAAQPETKFGELKIKTNIESFYLIINEEFDEYKFLEPDDIIELPVGKHQLRIVGENIDDYLLKTEIKENQLKELSIRFTSFKKRPKSSYIVLSAQRNVAITTDRESEIFINEESKGFRNVELFLPTGTYDLRIEHPEYGTLKKRISANYYEIQSISRYNENLYPVSIAEHFVPGLAFLKTKQTRKAVITYSGLAILGGAALYFNSQYKKKNELFNTQNQEYLAANTSQEAIQKRQIAEQTLSDMDNLNTRISLFSLATATFYAITTFDSFRKPKDGYKGPDFLTPQFSVKRNSYNGTLFPQISFTKRF